MSVRYENRDPETERQPQMRRPLSFLQDIRGRVGGADQGPAYDSRAFERVESLVHLLLAFAIVAGATVILKSIAFSPEAPARQFASVALPANEQLAAPSQAPAEPLERAAASQVAPVSQDNASVALPAAAVAPLAPPAAVSAPAASGDQALLDPKPLAPKPLAPEPSVEPRANAPEPLAPPSADVREKLVARTQAPAPKRAEEEMNAPAPEPETVASKSAEANDEPAPAARDVESGRMAKCYFKLSGRVQNSGPCRVSRTDKAVVFQLPGKPLQIAQIRGRVWSATLGGRSLGKVYKTGACWGAKGFYACDNG
ncbi:MAG: hypothetical protein CTY15_11785 [Methylocystis sp.]|nr:MAG: hypothetical protein CTY15_11785 [Methylocystis sp.]